MIDHEGLEGHKDRAEPRIMRMRERATDETRTESVFGPCSLRG